MRTFLEDQLPSDFVPHKMHIMQEGKPQKGRFLDRGEASRVARPSSRGDNPVRSYLQEKRKLV